MKEPCAVVESGDFSTDEVKINRIELAAPYIAPNNKTIPVDIPSGVTVTDVTLPLTTPETSFSYHNNEVSDFIVSIDEVGTKFTFNIKMSFKELDNVISGGTITDLKLHIPSGLVLVNPEGTYNDVTGEYSLPTKTMTGATLNIAIEADAINAAKAGIKYDYASHTVDFGGQVSILDGELNIKASDIKNLSSLPKSVTLRSEYTMSRISVTSFSGWMDYKIDDSSFSDIDLSDLPDFLSQSGTDIRISNPQIYLNITNPLYTYSLYAETDLRITSTGRDGVKTNYQLDQPFKVQGNPSTPAMNYCLSPTVPSKWYGNYTDCTPVAFTSLSDILSGNGIPRKLSVDLINPVVPRQKVTNLKLGESLGKVHGSYTFFAPLNLKAGSSIVYSDREDGWSSEDLDAVTISALEVNVNVTTNIPLKVNLTGYPIDKKGNRINNVDILGGEVNANADHQAVRLYITGEIKELDGIEFVATAIAADSSVALNPDMTITLTDLKAKVSGVYNKKL